MAATTCCFIHKIGHVRQRHGWDCGLACAEMIIRSFGPSIGIYESFSNRQSVWTIDIAYILHKFGVRFKMYTTMLQADDTYAAKVFYRDNFGKDECRVNSLFDVAETAGISLRRQSFTLEEIQHMLSQGNPIITLINANLMYCEHCSWLPHKLLQAVCKRLYQGHYIVVVGFDEFTGCILYRDPAVLKELCCMKYDAFDRARMCTGTDEDLIVIQRP